MSKVTLKAIAYGRSGDKGSCANIGVCAYTEQGHRWLDKHLTAAVVRDYFDALNPSEVIRYAIPNLLAFNFILKDALQGGGSLSLAVDNQGKALAAALLSMALPPIEAEELCLMFPNDDEEKEDEQ